MEQSSSSRVSLSHPISERERQVCEILLNLPFLIKKLEYNNGLPVWGAKGRRSAIDLPPSPRHQFPPEKKPKIDSPATPLSFPVTDSDHKIVQKSRDKKKKTREELLETIKELLQTKEQLSRELEKVKSFHNTRKAYNAVLKAKQQELQLKRRAANTEPSKSLNLDTELSLNITPFSLLTENHHTHTPHFLALIQQQQQHQQHSNYILQYPGNKTPPLSSTLVSDTVNHMGPLTYLKNMGPLGLSDLYEVFDAKYLQPLDRNLHNIGDDNNRATAAEARKKRMVRVREMKLNTALFRTSKC